MTRGITTTYSYDRADRIQLAGSTSYTLNAAGNLVERGTDRFWYDQANRLITATIAGITSTYSYDGDGKRASKTVSGTTTSFVYDVNRSLPVVLEDGARKYVWGLALAYSVGTTGTLEVYYTDGLGSVRAIANANGEVVQTYQSDEFGVPTLTQGTSNQPFQYTGEQRDGESGFLYLRARMYDPYLNRFLQSDPILADLRKPQALNLYSYALNNPLSYSDPSGMSSSKILKGWGDADNECFSSGGGALGGNVVYVTCLNIFGQTIRYEMVRVGPFSVPIMTISPMSPPRGGGGDDYGQGGIEKIGKTSNKAARAEFYAAVREIEAVIGRKLNADEVQDLHYSISGEGLRYWGIVDEGLRLFRK